MGVCSGRELSDEDKKRLVASRKRDKALGADARAEEQKVKLLLLEEVRAARAPYSSR